CHLQKYCQTRYLQIRKRQVLTLMQLISIPIYFLTYYFTPFLSKCVPNQCSANSSSKASLEISFLNLPSNVTDIEPVSSETMTVKASDTSEIPTAALCLVPKLLAILALSDNGK